MNAHRMLLDAADQMADLGVQGAPIKKKPDLMDDRTFKSLHLLDRYLADEFDDLDSASINVDVGGVVNNVRNEIDDSESTSAYTTEQIESVGKRSREPKAATPEPVTPTPVTPTIYEPTPESNEAVEKELHELFKVTDNGTAGIIDALTSNTAMVKRMGDVLGDWFDWEKEQAFRAAAHEQDNLPSIYGGSTNPSGNDTEPDADFPSFTPEGGGKNKNKKKPKAGEEGKPKKKGMLRRIRKWLSKRSGKAKGIALLALMGVAAYGAYEDKQGSKYHAGADDSDSDPEDADQVDAEDIGASDTRPEETPSLTDQLLPRDPIDQAAMAGTAALNAPSAVTTTKALVAAKTGGESVIKTGLGEAASGIKGGSLLTLGFGAYDAYNVYNDDTLTDKQKNREYAKVGGRTAGAWAGMESGAAALGTMGVTVGAAGGPIGMAIMGTIGTIAGGVIGGILGGDAGEKITDYVYGLVTDDQKDPKNAPKIDTQPIVDELRTAHEEDVKLQEERDLKDGKLSSPMWLYNSPMARPSSGAIPPAIAGGASNWGSTFRTQGTPIGTGAPGVPLMSAANSGGAAQFNTAGGAPNLVNMTDEQRAIINDVTGGDPKAVKFLTGVLNVENRGFGEIRSDKVSPSGAIGPYQFMPKTWNGLVAQGKASGDPTNFGDASRAAMAMYNEVNATYKGNEVAMVAHYNGGNAGGKATRAGQGDLSGLKQETKDYLNLYFHGTKNPTQADLAQTQNPNQAAVQTGTPVPDGTISPTAVPEVQPVERVTTDAVERTNPAETKQPIVNVTVPPAEVTTETPKTTVNTVPPMLQPRAPNPQAPVPVQSTLDDMPVFISEAGLGLMQMGTI